MGKMLHISYVDRSIELWLTETIGKDAETEQAETCNENDAEATVQAETCDENDTSSCIIFPEAEKFLSSRLTSKGPGDVKEEESRNQSGRTVSDKETAIQVSNDESGNCDREIEGLVVEESYSDIADMGPVVEEFFSDISIKYKVDPAQLGYGQYGVVKMCTNRDTRERFGVKSIRKSKVGKKNFPLLKREVKLLRELSHPNIIKLVDVYEDQDDLHLVTELCEGGELFDRIIAKREKGEVYSEKSTAAIIRSVLKAIAYCHDKQQVVHRDLKPENILFETEAEDSDIKLIDFGYAR
eukprot:CAMPEP_0197438846 /NCGR_PEP_ID=MMETSP1175-20131217/5729_1 /TAXON_ID=1003142 /ORGANISM="Triceratium dubium, Strain CCMP147" /LENGTH=296 /DNA_ID=CAMNT_0042968649 /DNA_START=363 /DNA_END=1250 /DNA_ORIENTATION=+